MCFSKQAIEIVPNLKEKQTEIEKIILQQSQSVGLAIFRRVMQVYLRRMVSMY